MRKLAWSGGTGTLIAILTVVLVSLGLTACDRQPTTEHGAGSSSESVEADQPMANAKTDGGTATEPARSGQQSVAARATEIFLGLMNEYRMKGSWDAVEHWATAFEWKAVPEQFAGLLNAERSFCERTADGELIIIGINPSVDSIGVAFMKQGGEQEALSLLTEVMTLRELIVHDDLGQRGAMYAATLGRERIGLISISWGTHSLSDGSVSLAFVDAPMAVQAIPKLERTFREMESGG